MAIICFAPSKNKNLLPVLFLKLLHFAWNLGMPSTTKHGHMVKQVYCAQFCVFAGSTSQWKSLRNAIWRHLPRYGIHILYCQYILRYMNTAWFWFVWMWFYYQHFPNPCESIIHMQPGLLHRYWGNASEAQVKRKSCTYPLRCIVLYC